MERLLLFALIGLVAQLIDGALGMAYGVTATTFLLSTGLSPVVASASVHLAEIFTTGISSLSHIHFKNVCWKTVRSLAIPGAIGSALGAYVLTSFSTNSIKPFVTTYLLIMGVVVLVRAFKAPVLTEIRSKLTFLGFIGGLLDAVGGGGWGPVVVSNLVAKGHQPRTTIGSANVAEFFVVLSASVTFVATLGIDYWKTVAALAVGGAIAAPFAAYLCRILPTRVLMFVVGFLLISLNGWLLMNG